MSEECAEMNLSYRLTQTRKRHCPFFMGAGKVSGDALPRKLVAIEAIAVHYLKPGSQNGNPGSTEWRDTIL